MKPTSQLWMLSGLMIFFLSACSTDNQQQKQADTHAVDSVYLIQGREITAAVFAVLSTEVSTSMQKGGVEKTVPYCQLRAYPITDSLAKAYDAVIKRTSHKIRNPLNAPDSLERKIIDDYLSDKSKQVPKVIHSSEKEFRYFAPILLATPCMKCHGKLEEDISPENYSLIQQLYPNDQAIGFSPGDLRGIWSVRFSH